METHEVINLVIASCALIISGIGISIARKANSHASKAMEIQNRPWLTVKVVNNEETDRFFDIEKNGNEIHWKVSFLVTNKGTTPATNISLPSTLNFKDIGNIDEDHVVELNNIVLAQGEKYQYNFAMCGQAGPEQSVDELLAKFKANDAPLEFDFPVTYEGIVKEGMKYKTKVRYEIKKDVVDILDGDYI